MILVIKKTVWNKRYMGPQTFTAGDDAFIAQDSSQARRVVEQMGYSWTEFTVIKIGEKE